MKVIFLDVDGVLNNYTLLYHYGFDFIDDDIVGLLGQIVSETGAEIVLTSTWRLDKTSKKIVVEALRRKKMTLLDSTISLRDKNRADEINEWLGRHKVKKYAIIDDIEDAGYGFGKNFFQTDAELGLTGVLATKIIKHLGKS